MCRHGGAAALRFGTTGAASGTLGTTGAASVTLGTTGAASVTQPAPFSAALTAQTGSDVMKLSLMSISDLVVSSPALSHAEGAHAERARSSPFSRVERMLSFARQADGLRRPPSGCCCSSRWLRATQVANTDLQSSPDAALAVARLTPNAVSTPATSRRPLIQFGITGGKSLPRSRLSSSGAIACGLTLTGSCAMIQPVRRVEKISGRIFRLAPVMPALTARALWGARTLDPGAEMKAADTLPMGSERQSSTSGEGSSAITCHRRWSVGRDHTCLSPEVCGSCSVVPMFE